MEYSPINSRIWAKLGSCGAYGIAALELAKQYDNIAVLTADVCNYSGLDRFKEQYPQYFYNLGIAEQNMLGVAAGLAKEGFIPFVSTYATFATMRCADQVRVNMGYMKFPIKLIGLTSGLSVGILGATHICIEDIAVMRSIPNIVILSPADCTETVKAILASAKINKPVYIRLTGTMNNPIVYKEDYNYEIGKSIVLKDGKDITILATGSMVANALKAADIIEENNLSVKVIDVHTLKPFDKQILLDNCNSKLIVTVEEHSIFGGLGSIVAENLSAIENTPKHLIIGIADKYEHAGEYSYLIEKYELTPKQIAEKILLKYKG